MRRSEESKRTGYNTRLRLLVMLSLMILASIWLSQLNTTWAEPSQNGLRQTIATRTNTATPGATCTPTQTAAPGVRRILLQEHDAYTGTRDTYLRSYPPGVASLDGSLRVKGGVEGDATLIRFDLLAHLPPNASVLDAELVFYVDIPSGSGSPLDIAAYRVLRPWDERTVDWTYYDTDARLLWTAAGCNGTDSDRVVVADDTITFHERGVFRGLDVTQSVRYWSEHPDENHGWLLKGVSSTTGLFAFDSSRGSIEERRPLLKIDYVISQETPTATDTPSETPTATPTMGSGQIQVLVFLDGNRNGVMDPGETGMSDVVVDLLTDELIPLSQQQTGSDGTCLFGGLGEGWYRVREQLPQGYSLSTYGEYRVRLGGALTTVLFGNFPKPATLLSLPIIVSD